MIYPRNKAFTLTELLIVVIVIGVLASVTLPKFSKVLETRKTTEAEELMAAVRTEQEKRCALDKNYTRNFNQLNDIVASNKTKNYEYSLQEQGISADSVGSDYTLKMPSYQDGRFCCAGAACSRLNKAYPDCSSFTVASSACVAEADPVPPPVPECTDGQTRGSQSCNGCGTQTTQICSGGSWTSGLGVCSKTVAECTPSCPAKPADPVQNCTCGSVTATQYCDVSTGYVWKQNPFPSCPVKPADVTETCVCGETRTQSFICQGGTYVAGDWSAVCKPQSECSCPEDGSQSRCLSDYYGPAGTWDESTCSCNCGGNDFDDREGSCMCPRDKPNWNGRTCYAEEDDCTRDPNIFNCCSRDEVEGIGFEFNESTQTCGCPSGMVKDTSDSVWRCRCGNAASNKANCCPNEPRTNGVCWIKNKKTWKLNKVTDLRDCAGRSGTCSSINPEGDECGSVGETCTVVGCTVNPDMGAETSGETYHYKCVSADGSSSDYSRNGW